MSKGNITGNRVWLTKRRIIFTVAGITLMLTAFFLLALDAARNFGNTVYCRENNMLIWDENSNISEKEIDIINQNNFEECMKIAGR